MAYLPELHRCCSCGVDLGPDNGDGICAACDSVDPCCVCGDPGVTYYQEREDCPSCGRAKCEFQMQVGLDYHDEIGNR